MEALFSICSNPSFSPIQTHKNPTTVQFPTSTSTPFNSQAKSQTWVSLKPHDFLQFVVSNKRLFKCKSSIERVETSSGDGESLKDGIRRKNLAAFVSGGGLNFQAVHEATLNGEVHGRFVVLVTNKHDCGGAKYARENGIPIIIYPGTNNEPDGMSSNDLVTTLSFWRQRVLWYEGS